MKYRELYEIMPFQVVDLVCEYKGVTAREMRGKSRKQELVMARIMTAYLFLYIGWGLETTGKLINRDHASISHYKKILLSNSDVLVNQNIKGLRLFLFDKGILVPNQAKFRHTVRQRNINK